MSGIIGIDEVGRGCWAGPLLIVAARATTDLPDGLKDSKLLSKKQREKLFGDIQSSCSIGEGWVSHEEIDSLGLSEAMRLGVGRALVNLDAHMEDVIIMDGAINYCEDTYSNVKCIPKADNLYPIVSAASIFAKVKRDRYMGEIGEQYPDYQFEKHVGYGTRLHSDLLQQFGVSPIHRLSFKPVKAVL